MVIKATTIQGYKLETLDGKIGEIEEFYFDDKHWTIRYLIAATGNWLTGRQVLLSPYALGEVNHENRHVAIDLTKKQIEDSPPLSSDKPVSRQFEESYYGYYGMPMYWGGPYMWGANPYPIRDRVQENEDTQGEKAWDHDLRSTAAVRGYYIQATDGDIGHVADFIIDDETWAIRYLIVDTRNWWPGKKVLLSPHWIKNVSWNESKVFVDLTRDAIKQSTEYTAQTLISREYETGPHQHYHPTG